MISMILDSMESLFWGLFIPTKKTPIPPCASVVTCFSVKELQFRTGQHTQLCTPLCLFLPYQIFLLLHLWYDMCLIWRFVMKLFKNSSNSLVLNCFVIQPLKPTRRPRCTFRNLESWQVCVIPHTVEVLS